MRALRTKAIGFLLVVVTCVAVLAPQADAKVKPTKVACKLDRITLKTAEEAYFATNDTYAEMDQLVGPFLKHASKYHTVTVNADGYTVTPKRGTGC